MTDPHPPTIDGGARASILGINKVLEEMTEAIERLNRRIDFANETIETLAERVTRLTQRMDGP